MGDLKDFFGRLSRIQARDERFKGDAYLFVMASLGRSMKLAGAQRHLTGGELLKGIQAEAEEQFGPMAATVFEHWGIKNSLDFGHIVFNMVQEGILSKTETDTLEDFKDGIFFEKLFDSAAGYRLRDGEKSLKDLKG